MEDLISGAEKKQKQKPVVNDIGLEFMEWAEKGWCLDKIIIKGYLSLMGDEGESCPYQQIKDIFINKINELSHNKYN